MAILDSYEKGLNVFNTFNKMDAVRVKVTNIPRSVTSETFALFLKHFELPQIESTHLRTCPPPANYFAYVNFHSSSDAKRAVELLHGKDIQGIKLSAKLLLRHEPSRAQESRQVVLDSSQQPPSLSATSDSYCSVRVYGLPLECTEKALRNQFEMFGSIQSAHLIGGRSGLACINYESADSACCAVRTLDGSNFMLSKIRVIPQVCRKRTSSNAQTSSPPASKLSLSLPPDEQQKALFTKLPTGLTLKPTSLSSVQQKAFSLGHMQESVDVDAVQRRTATGKHRSTGPAQTIAAKSPVTQATISRQTQPLSPDSNFSLPTGQSSFSFSFPSGTKQREQTSESQQLDTKTQSPRQTNHLHGAGMAQSQDKSSFSTAATVCLSDADRHGLSASSTACHTEKNPFFTGATSRCALIPSGKAEAPCVLSAAAVSTSSLLLSKTPSHKQSPSKERFVSVSRQGRVHEMQPAPPTTVEVARTPKFIQVGPSSLMKANPFPTHMKTGPAHTNLSVNPLHQFEKAIPLEKPVIGKILLGRCSQDLSSLQHCENVAIKLLPDGKQFEIRGERRSVIRTVEEMGIILAETQKKLKKKKFNIEAMYVPFFLDKQRAGGADDIAHNNFVDFFVVQTNPKKAYLPLSDFSQLLRNRVNKKDSNNKEPLKVVDLEEIGVLHHKAVKCWEKLDETGTWTQWSEQANNDFNRKLRESSLQPFWYDENGVTFKIDLAFKEAVVVGSKFTCRLRISDVQSAWLYYQDDNFEFVHYQEEQDIIEGCLLYGAAEPLDCRGRQCVFDYDKMLESDITNNQVTSVERRPPVSSSMLAQRVTFAVEGLGEDLDRAVEQLDLLMQGAVEMRTNTVVTSLVLPPFLVNFSRQYCVRTECSEARMQIEGVSEYVDKVLMKILDAVTSQAASRPRFSRQMSSSEVLFEIPVHWEPQTENTECKPVQRDGEEWKMVENEWAKTMCSIPIEKIERIQNKWLWKEFVLTRQRMSNRNQGNVNERLLFHGTRETPPEDVFKSEHGFDFRFSKPGMWGHGSYFAVDAYYSATNYSHTLKLSGRRQIFLAKVLTGSAKEVAPSGQTRNYRVPPLKTDGSRDRYDSVTGLTNSSRVFVVYDHSKAYPAFLITF